MSERRADGPTDIPGQAVESEVQTCSMIRNEEDALVWISSGASALFGLEAHGDVSAGQRPAVERRLRQRIETPPMFVNPDAPIGVGPPYTFDQSGGESSGAVLEERPSCGGEHAWAGFGGKSGPSHLVFVRAPDASNTHTPTHTPTMRPFLVVRSALDSGRFAGGTLIQFVDNRQVAADSPKASEEGATGAPADPMPQPRTDGGLIDPESGDKPTELTTELREWAERAYGRGVWELHPHRDELVVTPGCYRLLDLPGEHPASEDLLANIHRQDRSTVEKLIDRCHTSARPFEATVRLRGAGDGGRWVHVSGRHLDGGDRSRIRGVIRDVTDRKRVEQEYSEMSQAVTDEFECYLGAVVSQAALLYESLGQPDRDSTGRDGTIRDVVDSTINGSKTKSTPKNEVPSNSDVTSEEEATSEGEGTSKRESLSKIESTQAASSSERSGSARPGSIEAAAREIADHGSTLESLVCTSKQVEACFGGDERMREFSVTAVLEEIASSYGRLYPDVSIDVDGDDVSMFCNPVLLETLLANLVEHALSRDDQEPISITVRRRSDEHFMVYLAVDGGPHSPADVEALQSPSPDSYASAQAGVDARLVQWIVDFLEGRLAIEDHGPHGSVVTVSLPTVADPPFVSLERIRRRASQPASDVSTDE